MHNDKIIEWKYMHKSEVTGLEGLFNSCFRNNGRGNLPNKSIHLSIYIFNIAIYLYDIIDI